MDGYVMITDIFEYVAPFGIIGEILNYLILKNYMKNFLATRNKDIKDFA
jgi:hypothetical protein